MKRSHKTFNAFAVLLIFCLIVSPLEALPEETTSKTQLAIIFPLTGDAGGVGQALKNGFDLGFSKLSEKTQNLIELHYEDDGMQPKNTLTVFQNLKARGKIDILINAPSSTAKVLSPLAESNKIPLISIASDPKVVQGKKYVFTFWVTPEQEGVLAIEEAKRRGYKKIARISTITDGAEAINAGFDKANQGQIQIALDEQFAPDIKDFKTVITKIRALKDIDAIFVMLFPGQSGLFAKQARQLGIKQDFFSIEMFEDNQSVKDSAGALLGQWYINNDDPSQSFINEYKQKFPGASLWGASTAHDLALVIGLAIEKGYNKNNLPEFLANLKDFTGALGTFSASGDNRFTMPAAVKIVTEDGFKKIR